MSTVVPPSCIVATARVVAINPKGEQGHTVEGFAGDSRELRLQERLGIGYIGYDVAGTIDRSR